MANDYVPTTNRFEIVIPGIDTAGFFRHCDGLSMTIDVYEYIEGGNYEFVHKFPGHARYPNLRLSRGMTNDKVIETWVQKTLTKPDLKEVTIRLLDGQGQPVRVWTFVDAFPVSWSGPTLDASQNASAEEHLELAHSGLKRV
jgi:phage tail-like protein